ncbi:MAG TPA: hypothetical protein VFU63_08545 [Ktedonobacterales bacterium]|nr:hypothetical protein [Ktedonobacterales bacterium]
MTPGREYRPGNQAAKMVRDMMAHEMAARMYAALVTVQGRVALVVGDESRWRHESGYVFVPVELPGGTYADGSSPEEAIAAIGRRWFGRPLRLQPAGVTYGRSPAHAIDRLPPRDAPAPLLFLDRPTPVDPERGGGLHRVTVEVFRAVIDGGDTASGAGASAADDSASGIEPQPGCAGLLLLSWQALRQIVRGVPLADMLARDDVDLQCRSGLSLPPETLIYLTAEYGERTLLRVAAKYGVQALGKDIGNGTGF